MIKRLSGIILIFFMVSCATTQPKQNGGDMAESNITIEEKKLNTSIEAIRIARTIPYLNPDSIQANIRQKCTALGSQFSESTRRYASKYDIRLTQHENIDINSDGKVLLIRITDAYSRGNAFIGHRKAVATKAELYNNGQLVDTFERNRNSSGGMWGGFKGSCSVLQRTVNTLGNDIAKWLKENN